MISSLKDIFKHKKVDVSLDNADILWLCALTAQKNKINLEFKSIKNLLKEKNNWQDLSCVVNEIGCQLQGKYNQDELNFSIIKKEDKYLLAFSKRVSVPSSKDSNEVIEKEVFLLKDGTQLENVEPKDIVSIFHIKRNVKFYDLSEQEIARSFGFKWFIVHMMEHKKLWKNVVVWSLLLQCVSFAMPLMTQAVVDKVIVQQTVQTLIALVLGVFCFNLFNTLFSWSRQQLVLFIGNKIDNVLANQVFMHLLRLPSNYFANRNTGTIISRVHAVESIREFLAGTFITLVLDIPFVFIFMAVMFYYSTLLSAIALCFIFAMVLLSFLVAPLLRAKAQQQARYGGKNQAFLTEYVGSMETVKSLQLEGQLFINYRDNFNHYLESSRQTRSLAINYNSLMTWLEQALNLAILGIGAYICMTQEGFTIGMLMAFQMFCGRVTQPMLRIASMWQEFQQMQISMQRLKDVMDESTENYHYMQTNVLSGAPKIEFKNVAFGYEKNNRLYTDLNLTVEPGQLVVVQGPSGCGKSTLTKLLQGFYTNYEGKIEIGGIDISKMSVQQLRGLMGVVPQESVLFSGTITENFKLAAPDATFDEIVQACKMAGIHDVIQGLSQGYETVLGERGCGLSGGQKQRIAIARALLKKPKVLIFDEATSNLDPQSSASIAATINFLKGKVTMIFITHNDLNKINFDKVHLMKK